MKWHFKFETIGFHSIKKNAHTLIAFNLQNNFLDIAAHSLRKASLAGKTVYQRINCTG